MKVLICGGRNWSDKEAIKSWLCKLQDWGYIQVIECGAKGADKIAGELAREMGFRVIEYFPNWKKYGKVAGPIRNKEMLKENPNLVLAFHNNIEQSKGTKDCINQAKKLGIEFILVEK